ncbi:DNA-protecting protein DprA [Candidatus Berkelbacteria bacterium]|nr:DNA-protecting protein DprA [Candidatus Berkelbacteria bacterium]
MDYQILVDKDKDYPFLLKQIPDRPAKLFVKGKIIPDEENCLAVVGARKYSSYGAQVVRDFFLPLSQANLTIVSGLALGIDALAHQAALKGKKRTIAVLGCGIDRVYPSSHQKLAEAILKNNGAIVSEYPPGTPAYPANFPARNRIIAGLSRATLVIEAGRLSGSLITARLALEYNRDVLAVPGSIYNENSQGTNWLIKKGALPATSFNDIIEALDLPQEEKEKAFVFSPTKEEEMILGLLAKEPRQMDFLIISSGLTASKVAGLLLILELKGLIKKVGINEFSRCR